MLTIKKFPDPILRDRMPEFDFGNPIVDPIQLESEMIELMLKFNGIGLSANQAGIRTRMFVMGMPGHAISIFNPIIETAENFTEEDEGCLSFPGIYAKIKRPTTIKAKWQNNIGEWEHAEFDGLTARCFLHEYDHLEGIVYQDRLSPLKWALAVKKSHKQQGKR
jgi:peptide deformylase